MMIPLKVKTQMLCSIFFFMLVFGIVFGRTNSVIGMFISLAAFMNSANDMSAKPKLSFIKVLFLLLTLGICAYLNNPVTIFGCIITTFVVFGVTMTSYHLFGTNVYIPFLMVYFIMMCLPVTSDELPMRLLALSVGAVFIVAVNLLTNRHNSPEKSTKRTIDSLVGEIGKAVDLKLDGQEVSEDDFKVSNRFYSSMLLNFEYKIFPSAEQESILNVIKSFQYIGKIIADYDLTDNELRYIKHLLSNIREIDPKDIFNGIEVETKEMNIVLLNFECIAHEINKDPSEKKFSLPDFETLKPIMKAVFKRVFSFESVRFTFAVKMTFLMVLCEVLTLIHPITFPQWLYFAIIPLLMPYINDMGDSAKDRFYATYVGVIFFAIIALIIPHIPINVNLIAVIIFALGVTGFIYSIENVFVLTFFATVMSIGISLTSLDSTTAMELKIVWVTLGTVVATIFSFLVLPYSVEKETKRNLAGRYKLNGDFIELLKEKTRGDTSSKGTSMVVVNNILAENIEVTPENTELIRLQDEITDLSNFISNYMDKHELSDEFKENLIDIIDNGSEVSHNLNTKDEAILHSLSYLMGLFKKEEKLISG